MNNATSTSLVNHYKLLSDETRLRILFVLQFRDLCVCEISAILQQTQPKISKHLAKLRDLNVVQDERRDKFVYYALNGELELLGLNLQWLSKNIHLYPALQSDLRSYHDHFNLAQ